MAKTVGVGDPQISDSRDHQNIEIHSLNPMSSVEFSEKIDSKTVYVEIYYLHFVVCRNKQALTTDIAPASQLHNWLQRFGSPGYCCSS